MRRQKMRALLCFCFCGSFKVPASLSLLSGGTLSSHGCRDRIPSTAPVSATHPPMFPRSVVLSSQPTALCGRARLLVPVA